MSLNSSEYINGFFGARRQASRQHVWRGGRPCLHDQCIMNETGRKEVWPVVGRSVKPAIIVGGRMTTNFGKPVNPSLPFCQSYSTVDALSITTL